MKWVEKGSSHSLFLPKHCTLRGFHCYCYPTSGYCRKKEQNKK